MTLPLDNAPDGLNPVSGVDIERPVTSSVGLGQDNQNTFIPDSATNETEKLLDIDGLLEIARLISCIREDGRLGSGD
jgi:hypothetical protein